ncbi:hypothetical protein MGH68_05670 [Erysipelothrix sp. D19-032]
MLGRGRQFVSMGEDLVALYPSAARTYAQASQILGYDVLKLDESQLSETRFTQLRTLCTAYGYCPITRNKQHYKEMSFVVCH